MYPHSFLDYYLDLPYLGASLMDGVRNFFTWAYLSASFDTSFLLRSCDFADWIADVGIYLRRDANWSVWTTVGWGSTSDELSPSSLRRFTIRPLAVLTNFLVVRFASSACMVLKNRSIPISTLVCFAIESWKVKTRKFND